MDKTIDFSVNKKNNRERLDAFLSKEITYLTRSYIKKLIEKNKVKLYHKAQNKWTQGWTYIGKYENTQKAEVAAKQYTN